MNKRIIAIKISMFFVILISIFTYLSVLVYPKDNYNEYEWNSISQKGIISEADNTIDLIILGNSEADTSFNNIELYNEYGITSYGLGSPAQKVYESIDYLNLALKNQQPKYVLIECNFLFSKATDIEITNNNFKNVFPLLRYHHRLFSLTKKDFLFQYDYSYNNVMKGYRFLYGSNPPVDMSGYMLHSSISEHVLKANDKSFKKLISKCKQNDIIPILFSAPSVKSWSYSRHNAVANYAKEFDIEYHDLNLDNPINIDWSTDTSDYGEHVNYLGAKKVTKYFGEYFLNKGLVSHKSEEGYEKWDESFEIYKEQMCEIGINVYE